MTKDEALKLALEFIEHVNKDGWILADFEPEMYATITAIKEALVQPEHEWVRGECVKCNQSIEQPEQEQGDNACQEDDACPTEKAVLQRFWRGQPIPAEHYPTWFKAQPEQEPDKYMMDIECTKCGAKQLGILTVNTIPPQQEQEPVAWGVDWGKAGDIPCVSIIKRLPDGGIKVLAVEYAPYSYTTSPKQEQDDGMCTACENNLCTAKQGCVALDNPPQRTWVGLTDEELNLIYAEPQTHIGQYARAIEAKLKEKNT